MHIGTRVGLSDHIFGWFDKSAYTQADGFTGNTITVANGVPHVLLQESTLQSFALILWAATSSLKMLMIYLGQVWDPHPLWCSVSCSLP